MRKVVASGFILFLAGWFWLDAQAQGGNQTVSGAHRFERIAEGIYYATASGTMQVGANAPVIVARDETIIIDPGTSPTAGRALIDDVKSVTPKPVKYVIDSHFHYDHLFGNQVFGPDVQIVGHDHTRDRLKANTLEQYTFLTSVRPIPDRVAALRQRISAEQNPQQKTTLEQQVRNALAYQEQVKEVRQTPPNITFNDTLTLVRGGRELRLMYLGRGHTDTDVVTYLPQERIVATGDLMESVISYMGDSYPEDWIATLDRLKQLDFDTVLPGHGVPFKGKERITAFQDYLKDLIAQTNTLKRQGLSAEDAAARIDLTKHAATFPQIRAVGVDAAVTRRIYRLAQDPNAGPTP